VLEALAVELRKLRKLSGKSLRELEQATLSSDSALSRYLSGQAVPPWQVVEALCRLGGGSPDACVCCGHMRIPSVHSGRPGQSTAGTRECG
jgi:transcriptional regulator with XRE-family HTH domain